MSLYSFEGKTPVVHPDAFVAPTATLVGEVIVEAGASVWYNAVLRADYAPVIIRAGANVQDGAVLHAPPNLPCEIGEGATVAHLCLVHGATVGREAMIANHATVLDGAVIGARSMIAAGALVPGGANIPDEVVAMGSPAKVRGPIAGTNAEFWVATNPQAYRDLAARHRTGIRPVAPSPDESPS
ncbi:gamma carbonic anhydrase family protein [Actinomadura sp. GC306]|uniref:gamma carbonic anhydrase family protein n=1 Tax=Actinomadura sp. GC306 TaxID=2530367 RepID=UPI0010457BF5|nr:gamma carbonic anhydrase family protein [Actinomadura sp. GC306]TDC66097.1 gamma carbonic anhydrase family protein [Actinomadura sp. GC306]